MSVLLEARGTTSQEHDHPGVPEARREKQKKKKKKEKKKKKKKQKNKKNSKEKKKNKENKQITRTRSIIIIRRKQEETHEE